ncbi:MAG: ATP-binding cassette domain-containing protein [Proteobacteria bacterium]|nr:ATP-binding cassette domain-containing protein [Pseudomonadota bacterium]
MEVIEAENLTKNYGNFPAVDNVSFKVDSGEIVGFLGPNGAGKTTTMRMLTGFMPPSSGRVRVNGLDIHTRSVAARKHIGYLPETVPLYKDMSVKSYLRFFGSLRGMTRRHRESRIRETMKICRIEQFADSHIGKLSKGYRQLVGVAQAILHEPEVLILDEPTVGIDARQVVEIRKLIKKLGKKHTVILSSHILHEVSMICRKVLIIDRGRIVVQDTTKNLSARMKGVQIFEIEIKGAVEAVERTLKQIDGIQKITVSGKGDVLNYQVECQKGRDIRDELASTVVAGGFSLLGLKVSEMSLEDIFLKLTIEKGD